MNHDLSFKMYTKAYLCIKHKTIIHFGGGNRKFSGSRKRQRILRLDSKSTSNKSISINSISLKLKYILFSFVDYVPVKGEIITIKIKKKLKYFPLQKTILRE